MKQFFKSLKVDGSCVMKQKLKTSWFLKLEVYKCQ
jgi:hypothetical protein